MSSTPSICPECGTEVECGASRGKDECWCASYPHLAKLPATPGAACLCEPCLRRHLDALGTLPIAN